MKKKSAAKKVPSQALAKARELVKAAKKKSRQAKAELKAARAQLKAAKRAHKERKQEPRPAAASARKAPRKPVTAKRRAKPRVQRAAKAVARPPEKAAPVVPEVSFKPPRSVKRKAVRKPRPTAPAPEDTGMSDRSDEGVVSSDDES